MEGAPGDSGRGTVSYAEIARRIGAPTLSAPWQELAPRTISPSRSPSSCRSQRWRALGLCLGVERKRILIDREAEGRQQHRILHDATRGLQKLRSIAMRTGRGAVPQDGIMPGVSWRFGGYLRGYPLPPIDHRPWRAIGRAPRRLLCDETDTIFCSFRPLAADQYSVHGVADRLFGSHFRTGSIATGAVCGPGSRMSASSPKQKRHQ